MLKAAPSWQRNGQADEKLRTYVVGKMALLALPSQALESAGACGKTDGISNVNVLGVGGHDGKDAFTQPQKL